MSKLYKVILADPPWKFQGWGNAGPNDRAPKYNRMSGDEIASLIVPASKDAILFMWACWPMLPEALKVIGEWGFEYKTIAWVWVKLNENSMGTHYGLGYYTRGNSEPCLLATHGKVSQPKARDVQALIMSPIREHSRKPIDQYRKIERLYPAGPYLELFARETRPGWTSLGNGIDGQDINTALEGLRLDEDKSRCYKPDHSCS